MNARSRADRPVGRASSRAIGVEGQRLAGELATKRAPPRNPSFEFFALTNAKPGTRNSALACRLSDPQLELFQVAHERHDAQIRGRVLAPNERNEHDERKTDVPSSFFACRPGFWQRLDNSCEDPAVFPSSRSRGQVVGAVFLNQPCTSREAICARSCKASITVLAGGGLEGDNRGVRGTFFEDGGLMGAARIRFSPIKPRSIRGNRSTADQLRVLCPFMVTSVRHREPGVVPRRHAFVPNLPRNGHERGRARGIGSAEISLERGLLSKRVEVELALSERVHVGFLDAKGHHGFAQAGPFATALRYDFRGSVAGLAVRIRWPWLPYRRGCWWRRFSLRGFDAHGFRALDDYRDEVVRFENAHVRGVLEGFEQGRLELVNFVGVEVLGRRARRTPTPVLRESGRRTAITARSALQLVCQLVASLFPFVADCVLGFDLVPLFVRRDEWITHAQEEQRAVAVEVDIPCAAGRAEDRNFGSQHDAAALVLAVAHRFSEDAGHDGEILLGIDGGDRVRLRGLNHERAIAAAGAGVGVQVRMEILKLHFRALQRGGRGADSDSESASRRFLAQPDGATNDIMDRLFDIPDLGGRDLSGRNGG